MAATSSSSALMPIIRMKLGRLTTGATQAALGVDAVDHEAGEHLQQDVAGGHRDEQPQREAERADHEGDELDRDQDRQHPPGRAVRHEQEKKWKPCLAKPTISTIAKRDDREHAGDGEVAGDGERVKPDDRRSGSMPSRLANRMNMKSEKT
jgi:hypothetical protein